MLEPTKGDGGASRKLSGCGVPAGTHSRRTMKMLPLLFVAGVSGAFLSGCYVDRKPTMTMEDRMMASDKEIADYEAAKKAEAASKSARVETLASPVVAADASDLASLKAKFPAVKDWREETFAGRKFVFGTASSGATAEMTCWVFEPGAGAWRRIFTVTLTPSSAGFSFDATTGVVAVRDGVSGKTVFSYDLGEAVGK